MSHTPINGQAWGFVPRTRFAWRTGPCGGRAGRNILLLPGGTTNKRQHQ